MKILHTIATRLIENNSYLESFEHDENRVKIICRDGLSFTIIKRSYEKTASVSCCCLRTDDGWTFKPKIAEINFNPDKDIKKIIADINKRFIKTLQDDSKRVLNEYHKHLDLLVNRLAAQNEIASFFGDDDYLSSKYKYERPMYFRIPNKHDNECSYSFKVSIGYTDIGVEIDGITVEQLKKIASILKD